jgi:probable rRNA maturation factor
MSTSVILKQRAAGLTQSSLAMFIEAASRAARLRGAVNVLVTSDREMQRLNRRFRGRNSTTDVLSFPMRMNGSAGDIAVSLGLAARNAKRLGHSTADEVRILVLHGILHLAGYDHERDEGEMAATESRLRRHLGLPDGLIERVTASPNKRSHTGRATRVQR